MGSSRPQANVKALLNSKSGSFAMLLLLYKHYLRFSNLTDKIIGTYNADVFGATNCSLLSKKTHFVPFSACAEETVVSVDTDRGIDSDQMNDGGTHPKDVQSEGPEVVGSVGDLGAASRTKTKPKGRRGDMHEKNPAATEKRETKTRVSVQKRKRMDENDQSYTEFHKSQGFDLQETWQERFNSNKSFIESLGNLNDQFVMAPGGVPDELLEDSTLSDREKEWRAMQANKSLESVLNPKRGSRLQKARDANTRFDGEEGDLEFYNTGDPDLANTAYEDFERQLLRNSGDKGQTNNFDGETDEEEYGKVPKLMKGLDKSRARSDQKRGYGTRHEFETIEGGSREKSAFTPRAVPGSPFGQEEIKETRERNHKRQSDAVNIDGYPELYSIHRGEVTGIAEYGAFVRLKLFPRVTGLVHKSQMAAERVEKVSDEVEKNDRVWVKVVNITDDPNRGSIMFKKRFSLSMKQVDQKTGEDLTPGFERRPPLHIRNTHFDEKNLNEVSTTPAPEGANDVIDTDVLGGRSSEEDDNLHPNVKHMKDLANKENEETLRKAAKMLGSGSKDPPPPPPKNEKEGSDSASSTSDDHRRSKSKKEENITSTITARGGNVIIIMIIVIGTDTAAKVEGNTNGIIPRVGKLVAAHQAEASAKPRTRLVKS
eukprot:CAMPEP_0114502110 /NCGR_PEP_ID=MMETSP0109-20121206/8867_1 /TAXON_ID=29199 /ORGANISM="Chlorarachnion reptans, Strain CCCM449" /LENGTH=654 /DNA_ID=CAMNT_0001679905 /DNA_START=223 /DNA_END=2189 /DNA_ORIENTATION=+